MIDNIKSFRLLDLYERLNRGEVINKKEFSKEFKISEKSFQRDIEDLRAYLSERYESGDSVTVEYSQSQNGYYLFKKEREWLTDEEILSISKILLESRAFNKEELEQLINKLILQASPSGRININEIILNEKYHYKPTSHNKKLFSQIWEISNLIKEKNIAKFLYERQDGKKFERTVKPVGIVFSEFYFYLLGYINENNFPTVFRLDRISNLKSKDEKFKIPYAERFEDGEFRNRVQFMYTGELLKVRFKFWGSSLSAVLDRLPTAKIIGNENEKTIIEAEIFGKGIKMWFLSQMEYLEVISPKSLRDEMKETVMSLKNIYMN